MPTTMLASNPRAGVLPRHRPCPTLTPFPLPPSFLFVRFRGVDPRALLSTLDLASGEGGGGPFGSTLLGGALVAPPCRGPACGFPYGV